MAVRRLLLIALGLLVVNLGALLLSLPGDIWWPIMLSVAGVSAILTIVLLSFVWSLWSRVASTATPVPGIEHLPLTTTLVGDADGDDSKDHQGRGTEGLPQQLPGTSIARDPLDNKPWLGLVEECVALFDELDRHGPGFDPPRQELAEHVCFRLREILERSGVEIIEGATLFDRIQHQQEGITGSVPLGAHIAETLSPGFHIGRRVLRRARVKLG
ncbi:MAG TPA: hypothetical protein VJ183_01460 [Chloroflexia bacterium]|nr:hypothetical protein [Chloroflexia bacterium]